METHGKDADEMGGGNDEIGHLEIEMQQWNEWINHPLFQGTFPSQEKKRPRKRLQPSLAVWTAMSCLGLSWNEIQ